MADLLADKIGEYDRYIIRHCTNVFRMYQKHIESLKVIFPELNEPVVDTTLRNNVMMHDASKMSPEEFDAYRRWFYPVSEDEKKAAKEDFDKAWEHHYTVNKHHWDHWFNKETKETIPMELVYIIEMFLDWEAMGVQFGNSAKEYYEKNKDLIMLHPDSRKTLEDIFLITVND